MTAPVKGPAQLAIDASEVCGKRGPKTGALCRRFKGHEQPPSPLLGADFHEARDSQGILERWPVAESEIPPERRGVRYAIEREAAAMRPVGPFPDGERLELESEKRRLGLGGIAIAETDAGPLPEQAPSDKEAELYQVRELLKAAGFEPLDNFSRQGAPGSGVHYLEMRAPAYPTPFILRTQFLFNKPVSWTLMGEVFARDLEGLRGFLAAVGS